MNWPVRRMSLTIWTMVVLALVSCAGPTPSGTPAATVIATSAASPSRAPAPTLSPVPPLTATPPATLALATAPPRASATPVPSATSSPTAIPHFFDDVDSRALLAGLFPNLQLAQNGDEFIVNGNPGWRMWVNSRVEGRFTQDTVPELAAIIANDAPHVPEAELSRVAPWGPFLAVFQRKSGKLEVVQRSFLFPTSISPAVLQVAIDRTVDYDHSGRNELLITTDTLQAGISSRAGFLYEWNGQAFTELWSTPIGEDNTAALNQSRYYASTSQIRFADLDGNGFDEIIVDTTWIDYARDAQGLANLDKEIARRSERRVFRWEGATFVPDVARVTPLPPLPSATP